MDLALRNVKAVHLSSSVPSGDSMRPVKQAFQISRTNRGVGILCTGQTILKDCTSKTKYTEKCSVCARFNTYIFKNPQNKLTTCFTVMKEMCNNACLLSANLQHYFRAEIHYILLNEKCTCILLIIINCSTNGCVSPVRFMVPSSMMMAWTDGKDAWSRGSHCTDSIWGILRKECRVSIFAFVVWAMSHTIYVVGYFHCRYKWNWNIYPFTSDKLSSNLVLSVGLGTLPSPSVTFMISCSTLLQEPVDEEQRKCCETNGLMMQKNGVSECLWLKIKHQNCFHYKYYVIWVFPQSVVVQSSGPFVLTYLWQGRTMSVSACLWYISNKDKHTHSTSTPCSSSRAMWTRALFLVLLIRVCSLSWHALRLASVLADKPSSLSFSQYQAQPCSNHTTTPRRARHSPMHSSAFPWQLWRPRGEAMNQRQFMQREKLHYNVTRSLILALTIV